MNGEGKQLGARGLLQSHADRGWGLGAQAQSVVAVQVVGVVVVVE